MTWLHETSQAALAAAVMTLGLVMLLELRSIARLRRSVQCNLDRVFEQLDLLRFENQQLIEAQTHRTARVGRTEAGSETPRNGEAKIEPRSEVGVGGDAAKGAAHSALHALNPAAMLASGLAVKDVAERCGLPAGEARLLASLAAARASRAPTKAA